MERAADIMAPDFCVPVTNLTDLLPAAFPGYTGTVTYNCTVPIASVTVVSAGSTTAPPTSQVDASLFAFKVTTAAEGERKAAPPRCLRICRSERCEQCMQHGTRCMHRAAATPQPPAPCKPSVPPPWDPATAATPTPSPRLLGRGPPQPERGARARGRDRHRHHHPELPRRLHRPRHLQGGCGAAPLAGGAGRGVMCVGGGVPDDCSRSTAVLASETCSSRFD